MARIPDDEIERLKQEVTLQRLVEAHGIELKRHGADLIGLCPFHDDREPSLVVTPKKNLWHCLGACQTGGSVIDWVMRSRGVSFRHAVELLRNDHPSLAEPVRIVAKGTTAAVKLATPFEVNADDQRVLRQVVDYYHETLKQVARGAGVPGGARPRASGDDRALPHRLRQPHVGLPAAGEEPQERRGDPGPFAAARHPARKRATSTSTDRWSFPVFDLAGNITEMYGRKITPGLREGTPLHLYLPGPHQGVWNELALQVSKEIILCEALIDALTFWCAGFRNVTASYGVGGFTDDHRAAFRKHGVQRVWIAYDRDEAGRKRRCRYRKNCWAWASSVCVFCFRKAWTPTSTRARRRRQPGFWQPRSTRRSGSGKASHRSGSRWK